MMVPSVTISVSVGMTKIFNLSERGGQETQTGAG
jgi:hypothetical protein